MYVESRPRYAAPMRRTLEIPVDAIDSALQAAAHTDRLELCDDLASEGWSPTTELVREVRRGTRCEVVAMIRPRVPGMPTTLEPAAFLGTPAFREACLGDIEAAADAGTEAVGGSLPGIRAGRRLAEVSFATTHRQVLFVVRGARVAEASGVTWIPLAELSRRAVPAAALRVIEAARAALASKRPRRARLRG